MRDHTSLKAWQEAHQVVLAALELARIAWKPYAAALFSQLQRASLSVELNIAEGYTFGNSPTFTRHLAIAYGSAVETGELLALLAEGNVVDPAMVAPARERNGQCRRLILGLLKRRRPLKGVKSEEGVLAPSADSVPRPPFHFSLFTLYFSLFTLHPSPPSSAGATVSPSPSAHPSPGSRR